ncbi:hypothetical protein [Pseudomonas cremoricolorata]|uniref:Uncharacterized protein n=1 Tax=Pseudomonas cremoricolorata TaxID=157783 RepID=A0A089WMM5_9PSED|nr:hypothetical protein [Pseudomonas cremoricolorata]AIR90555.1 hypothetical protein LK03_15255 [Pseudomonas cremoricolorata]
MQTIMHPAFREKLAVLEALLERSRTLRAETRAKIGAPRYQVFGHGQAWDVVDLTTDAVQGFAFSYRAAMVFASAMEAGAATKCLTQ